MAIGDKLVNLDDLKTLKQYTDAQDGDLKSTLSNRPEVKDSTETGIDLDVSDENGNVIVRFKDGHIQTKNFDSSKNAGNGSEVKDSTETGADLDFSDPSGNVILRLQDGHIKTKNFDSASLIPQIITVASSGADYTSIRTAVEFAQASGASADNPYTIQISPGIYDILSEFTSEEVSVSGFDGLTITDGITLEGMGDIREQTVLYAEMDTTEYDQTKRNYVSTLNMHGNVGMKNLTVKAKNIRYAVHDDKSFTSSKPKVRKIENCRFFAESTTSGGYGNISYGAGTDGGKIFVFDGCDFGDMIHVHTNAGSRPNLVLMRNCRAHAFTATDYASTGDNHYYINSSSLKWVRVEKGSNWSVQHLFFHSDTNAVMVEGWDGMVYETGDTARYQQITAMSYPKAVAIKNSSRYNLKYATGADDCIGVLYYYDSTNNIAYVQHGGWMCAELLGFSSPAIGNYLVVASDGSLSLGVSDTNAIGRVVFENASGSHFIKLSI